MPKCPYSKIIGIGITGTGIYFESNFFVRKCEASSLKLQFNLASLFVLPALQGTYSRGSWRSIDDNSYKAFCFLVAVVKACRVGNDKSTLLFQHTHNSPQ